MVQLIAGNKGKGKTKHLLDKVNAEVKTASGNITYLDKSAKHMFELNNKSSVWLNVSDYFITNSDEFLGFICGILSQDHDLQQMYFDSFLKIACLEGKDISPVITKLENIGDAFGVDFILSISLDESELPADMKKQRFDAGVFWDKASEAK